MASRAAISALALVVISGQATAVGAQEARARLDQLVHGLDLTERGAPRWLSALTLDLTQPAQERVVAVTPAGELVDSLLGQSSHAVLGPAFDTRLLQPGANLVLVHNHPNDSGLSGDDLLQLTKPGVAAVAAVGHRRSVYVAIAGRSYDRNAFEHRQYAIARDELARQLLAQQARGLAGAVVAEHFTHLVSLALAEAGVIDYRATLCASRRESFERNRLALTEAVVFAAGRLKARLKR